jgi:hypothetical protein
VETKYFLPIALLLVVLGYGLGRYLQPAKVVTKTQIVTQTVVHDHIHTVTITVTKPDGTKTTTTTTDNNSVSDKDTQSNSSTVTTYSKPDWKVSGLAGLQLTNLHSPVYGAEIDKRLLGPIFVGVWGLTNSTAGVSVGLEF